VAKGEGSGYGWFEVVHVNGKSATAPWMILSIGAGICTVAQVRPRG
jgi:hypothetical protein